MRPLSGGGIADPGGSLEVAGGSWGRACLAVANVVGGGNVGAAELGAGAGCLAWVVAGVGARALMFGLVGGELAGVGARLVVGGELVGLAELGAFVLTTERSVVGLGEELLGVIADLGAGWLGAGSGWCTPVAVELVVGLVGVDLVGALVELVVGLVGAATSRADLLLRTLAHAQAAEGDRCRRPQSSGHEWIGSVSVSYSSESAPCSAQFFRRASCSARSAGVSVVCRVARSWSRFWRA